jgi:hypothetical protein
VSEARKRALEIKGTLEIQPTDIADRLKKIEDNLEAAKGKGGGKDFWDKLQASGATGMFSSIILALVGFMLTGAISNSVQQRQMELASVEKMQSLISALSNPMIPEKDEDVDTTTLAAFGRPAIPAFVTFLGKDTPTSLRIADKGLHMVGSAHPSWVCVHLTSILRNRSSLYSWRTFSHTLDLVGDINCQTSENAVGAFMTSADTLDKLNAFVNASATQKDFDDLRAQAKSILERLQHAPKPSNWRGLKRFFHIISDDEVEEAG